MNVLASLISQVNLRAKCHFIFGIFENFDHWHFPHRDELTCNTRVFLMETLPQQMPPKMPKASRKESLLGLEDSAHVHRQREPQWATRGRIDYFLQDEYEHP